MEIVTQRIKEGRKKLGITQQQLAFDTGLSVGGIQSIELGRSNPNIETLSKLADRFGCTTDYLLGRTDDPHEVIPDNELTKFDLNLMIQAADMVLSDKELLENLGFKAFDHFTKMKRIATELLEKENIKDPQ